MERVTQQSNIYLKPKRRNHWIIIDETEYGQGALLKPREHCRDPITISREERCLFKNRPSVKEVITRTRTVNAQTAWLQTNCNSVQCCWQFNMNYYVKVNFFILWILQYPIIHLFTFVNISMAQIFTFFQMYCLYKFRLQSHKAHIYMCDPICSLSRFMKSKNGSKGTIFNGK